MKNISGRSFLRYIVLIAVMITFFFVKDYFRSFDTAVQSQTDFAALIAQKTGEDNVVIYRNEQLYNVSGFASNYQVIYLVGDGNSYTDMGCAFFSEAEINKKIGFINVVSGYDAVLDKITPAHVWCDKNGFMVCEFDLLTYQNWTVNESVFAVTNDNDVTVKLTLNSGETKLCDESYIKTVYEIGVEDKNNLNAISFYDANGDILTSYSPK